DLERGMIGEYFDFDGTQSCYENILNDYNTGSKKQEAYIDKGKEIIYKVKDGVITKEFKINGETKTEKIKIVDEYGGLNIRIISMARKGELPEGLPLTKEIKKWQNSCVANGEFIAPYYKQEGFDGTYISKEDLLIYYRILKGEANTEEIAKFQNKNYKNALSKDKFYEIISAEEGFLIYVDVKDMGSYNLLDFYKNIKKANQNILLKTEEEKRLSALNNSGEEVTQVFKELNENIRKSLEIKFPGKEISIYIGGDEIGIFVKGEKLGTKIDSLNAEIFNLLHESKLNLEGRITQRNISNKDKNGNSTDGSSLVESLDKITEYSKAIEKRISELKETLRLRGVKLGQSNIDYKLYNDLKDFVLFVDDNGIYNIIFLNNPFGTNLKDNTFKLDEIVDRSNSNNTILQNNSPLITYLKENIGIYKSEELDNILAI
ncbi:MAG: hypothetical protein PHO80_04320, partial [Candidatus Gracilibacteria bacterium]|nr:hypothetical protein [Candidatus Gracilibacteria bacterium]